MSRPELGLLNDAFKGLTETITVKITGKRLAQAICERMEHEIALSADWDERARRNLQVAISSGTVPMSVAMGDEAGSWSIMTSVSARKISHAPLRLIVECLDPERVYEIGLRELEGIVSPQTQQCTHPILG